MAQITKFNASGAKAGTVDLDDHTFGIQPNVPVLHQVVTAQLAARRSGTQSTKTRAEVSGGGAKPYRQKGTGNARQGSIRAPHYSGGGIALGPKPRKYTQKTPKKMINLALRSALSDRAAEGKVVVVESWGWDTPNTKAAQKALIGLGVTGKALVVVGRDDAAAALSFRNIASVQLITPAELNAYDVLCNDWIVFTESAVPAFSAPAKASTDQPVAEKPVKAAKPAKAVEAEAVEEAAVVVEEEAVAVEEDVVEAPVAEIATFATLDTDADAESSERLAGAWAGSVQALADGSMPEGYEIKGNADSMLYHVPGSAFYGRTIAEVWFDTEANAEAAGFAKPASQRDADESAAETTEK